MQGTTTLVLYSLWYHHTYRWPSHAQSVHRMATYTCDDTRDCIIQFCPLDDEHMCPKHVEAWNKLIIKFSASSWLILRCKVVKQTSVRATDMIQLCIGLGAVSACPQHWTLFHTLSTLSLGVTWAPLLLKIWRKVENITLVAPWTENNFGCGTLHAEVSWTLTKIQQCFFSKWTENTTLY